MNSKNSLKHNFKYIIPLNSRECFSRYTQTGAKASRLAQLLKHGMPVPIGYTITVRAFQEYCRYNKIDLSQSGNYDERRNLILRGVYPPVLLREIKNIKNKLGKKVVVRSSSVAEDNIGFSMAGQYHTCIDVTHPLIEDKIRECWSGITKSAVADYAKKGKIGNIGRLAVLVQDQIDPDYSGVLFTIDPVLKSTDNMVCEWVNGHCEKLVSGDINPRRIHINRTSHAVLQYDVPENLKTVLAELASHAKHIEKLIGHPVDIEWCVTQNRLYIVQARPITTVTSRDHTVWTNVNMTENFPLPMTPLGWSSVDTFYTMYMRSVLRLLGFSPEKLEKQHAVIDNLTGIHNGRIYYNLNNWYEVMHFFPSGKWLIRFLDNYIGQNIPFTFVPARQIKKGPGIIIRPFTSARFYVKLFTLFFTARRKITRFERRFSRKRQTWKDPAAVNGPEAILQGIESLYSFINNCWRGPAGGDIMSMIFPGILSALIESWLPENQTNIKLALIQGIDIKSLEPAKQLISIAKSIKKHPDLTALVSQHDYRRLQEILPDEITSQVGKFLEQYGERCYYDCMLDFPTFCEDQDLLWDIVAKYIMADDLDSLFGSVRYADNKAVFKRAFKSMSVVRKIIISCVLKLSCTSIQLRERARLSQSFIFADLRGLCLSIGDEFLKRNYIADANDIFYLCHYEIKDIINGKYMSPGSIKELVKQRKTEHDSFKDSDLPEFFLTAKGEYYKHTQVVTAEASGDSTAYFQGIGVSNGIVKARARIIPDPRESGSLQPGDIMVTRSTDPGWTPLFLICGGLVLERGGMLSHGAIVAREFNIPAVTSIAGATKKIKEGSLITINGTSGTITIEQEKNDAH